MNNKAQTFAVYFMLGVVFIVLALSLSYPIKQVIDTARSDYSCDVASSHYDKSFCTSLDIITPLFILLILGFAGILIRGGF
jgi:hypothetical protein